MYEAVVTLFNRYKSHTGDMWYPTILRNCHLDMDKAAIIARYGSESSDNAVLHVKYSTVDGKKMVCGKQWLPPKEWKAQSNNDFSISITFANGTGFDFFMLGEWEGGEKPVSDNDFPEGLYNELNKRYDYVFAITSVGGPYKTIKHFEIMGK